MLNKNTILALIPARSGSKRIPNKNITPLCGKPLMLWTIEFALESKLFENVVVSSDSEEYLAMAERAGATPLLRPAELAEDKAGDGEIIRHALDCYPADVVAYLRPTTPFRERKVFQNALKFYFDNDFTSLRSVQEMTESAYKCFELLGGLLIPVLQNERDVTDEPSQAVEPTFHPNGYIDLVRSNFFSGALWGQRKGGFVTPRVPEIDTPEDLEYAEWWYERRKNENR